MSAGNLAVAVGLEQGTWTTRGPIGHGVMDEEPEAL